jgi:hypothetical protein
MAVGFCLAMVAGASGQLERADVVVYGGTPAGIMAAISAARGGHSVALIDINAHVGGVVSGGLVDTDTGDRKTVGGLADDFLKRTLQHYRDTYGPDSPQFSRCHDGVRYEPHVAEKIFEEMLKEQPAVKLWRRHRYRSVTVEGGKITGLTVDDLTTRMARTFTGQIFIDASYEGDMMALARVPYRVGRESRAEFGEYLAGVSAGPKEQLGLGDHRTQAYNYRVSITSRTENRVLFPKPEKYDPLPWRATYGARILRTGVTGFAGLYVNAAGKIGPNDKFDTNWGDLRGGSEGYAEGDWETRERIAARHRDYFLSLLWYLQNDPELPEGFRADAQKWGLPADEFTDNGHFPFQLYVREGRRMLGRYVLHENDLTQDRWKSDGICTGSYGIDCHVVQTLLHEGKPIVEHTRHVSVENYDIPYACLTPHEPGNLLVPVCLSATHVAYCSLRMEPVYMMLGQAAGAAAHLAIAGGTTVQEVKVDQLRERLRGEGAVLDAGYQPPVRITWTPSHPKVGEVVHFTAETGVLKDPLKQVWWDFEGDGSASAQWSSAEHTFHIEKHATVSLIAEDTAGRRRIVSAEVPIGAALGKDVAMDEFDAELAGRWTGAYPEILLPDRTRTPDVFFGPGSHSDAIIKGKRIAARARFQPNIPRAGRYEVCLGFRPAKGQATNVPVIVRHANGTAKVTVNQQQETTPFNFVPIGEYRFKAGTPGFVELTNREVDGRTTIDGVRWVWLGE